MARSRASEPLTDEDALDKALGRIRRCLANSARDGDSWVTRRTLRDSLISNYRRAFSDALDLLLDSGEIEVKSLDMRYPDGRPRIVVFFRLTEDS